MTLLPGLVKFLYFPGNLSEDEFIQMRDERVSELTTACRKDEISSAGYYNFSSDMLTMKHEMLSYMQKFQNYIETFKENDMQITAQVRSIPGLVESFVNSFVAYQPGISITADKIYDRSQQTYDVAEALKNYEYNDYLNNVEPSI